MHGDGVGLNTDPYLCKWGPILILKSFDFDFLGRMYYCFEFNMQWILRVVIKMGVETKTIVYLSTTHTHTWSTSWVKLVAVLLYIIILSWKEKAGTNA